MPGDTYHWVIRVANRTFFALQNYRLMVIISILHFPDQAGTTSVPPKHGRFRAEGFGEHGRNGHAGKFFKIEHLGFTSRIGQVAP
jgi:hypothetical protein